jgi:hypothetical protein
LSRCPKTCIVSQHPFVIESCPAQANVLAIHALYPHNPKDEDYSLDTTDIIMINHILEIRACSSNKLAIAKTTMSTKVVMRDAPKPSKDHIPAQFQHYHKVFSEEASHRLPKHQPWDHAIDLKPDSTMRNTSIYHLTPKENESLKEYIHLKKISNFFFWHYRQLKSVALCRLHIFLSFM